VYLRPLVDEVLQLWAELGVRVWDEHKQEEFDLRALLFVTINDWPATIRNVLTSDVFIMTLEKSVIKW
jgi:hypothetical protein